MLTTAALRRGLAARVATLGGLSEARGLLGVAREPNSVVDRSFSVVMQAEEDGGQRVVAGTHLLVGRAFSVIIAHKLGPKDGREAYDRALDDTDRIKAKLLANSNDAIRETDPHTRYLGTPDPEQVAGGAYLLTTMRWYTRFLLDISVTGTT